MPPKERCALIRAQVEQDLARRKDQSWDSVIDVCLVFLRRPILSDCLPLSEPISSPAGALHKSIVQVYLIFPAITRTI